MLEIENISKWSEALFGNCSLGDKRLTKRLVKIGEQLSSYTGMSLSKSCDGKEALVEGSYRFIRNENVKAKQIADGGYAVTASLAKSAAVILAIEDTTTLSYTHDVKQELGYTGNQKEGKKRGYLVHTTMLMDGEKEKTIGLIAQERWCRDSKDYGKKNKRKEIAYEQKESYKWERNSHELEKRLGSKLKDTLSICDREADIYEYISYKLGRGHRFIVRAQNNRKVKDNAELLFEDVAKATKLGSYKIEVAQKAGRKKREIEIELSAKKVTLVPPQRAGNQGVKLTPITLNVVMAREKSADEERLEWILLTTESVATFEEARKITRYYELRWRIEDFHKAWKSGTGVERQRMQSADNLEKMIVILSFVAIRLLQLKEYFEQDRFIVKIENNCISCEELLTEIEWKVLWMSIEEKEIPSIAPSAAWAYQAIAKLGGWSNSKRTGKASWATIWDGWFRLNERVEGFMVAQSMTRKI